MNWLWVGDSHLEAMAPRIRAKSAELGVGGSISYRSGWSSGRWLRDGNVPTLVAHAHPDRVVYVLGTNDDPVNPAALRGLVAAASGAEVIWFGPFHSAAHDGEFRAVLGDRFVSGAALARGLSFPTGNVHLTAGGYQELADRLVDRALDRPFIHPAWIVGGAVLASVVLVAVGQHRAYASRWTPAEPHPFDPASWRNR